MRNGHISVDLRLVHDQAVELGEPHGGGNSGARLIERSRKLSVGLEHRRDAVHGDRMALGSPDWRLETLRVTSGFARSFDASTSTACADILVAAYARR